MSDRLAPTAEPKPPRQHTPDPRATQAREQLANTQEAS